MKMGETLRRLRKEKQLTQDELAAYLGVSFQTVSKWERDECYPDITMLPSLANFFGVTVDELIGMEAYRSVNRLHDVYRTAHENEESGKIDEAIAILRQAVHKYPGNYGLLSELALALSMSGGTEDETRAAAEEAAALSERVLTDCANEKIRGTTRANTCYLIARLGDAEKAHALARSLPHIWESREFITADLADDARYADALRQTIRFILRVLTDKIEAQSAANRTDAKKIALGYASPEKDARRESEQLARISDFLNAG